MRTNRTLFYWALLGIAVAVPMLYQQMSPKQPPKQAAAPQAQTAPAAPSTPRAPVVKAPPVEEQTYAIETEEFSARVSNVNGGIKSFRLKDEQFSEKGKVTDIVTTNKPEFYPLSFRVRGAELGHAAYRVQADASRSVRLQTEADGLVVTRKLEAGKGPYQVWVTTSLENRGASPRKLSLEESTYHYVPREAESGGVPLLPARSSALSSGLCSHADDLEREERKNLADVKTWSGGVHFTGIENVYFLNALVSVVENGASCQLTAQDRGRDAKGEALGSLFSAVLRYPEQTLAPGQQTTVRTLAYLGPKTPEELSVAGHNLRRAINTGFFTKLADGLTGLLALIHGGVGNWGVAIILLTFFVKLVLYPLTHKQMASMAKMKELKPEMDRINELYADDREKKGAAVMELYRKKGVNPMAGCFPVLLQLPIWFSLYSSLSSNIRLLNAPFALWWSDLSSPDPYFVLPLALGVLMFVQQKLAPPTGTDPMQAKMMLYMMPTMITSFMLFLPAGLCLYMFTNSALSILQQRFIEARLKNVSATTMSKMSTMSTMSNSTSAISSVTPVATHASATVDADGTLEEGSKDKLAQRRLRRGRK
jgi:YidC/Oxa1 family membrane protein insertase